MRITRPLPVAAIVALTLAAEGVLALVVIIAAGLIITACGGDNGIPPHPIVIPSTAPASPTQAPRATHAAPSAKPTPRATAAAPMSSTGPQARAAYLAAVRRYDPTVTYGDDDALYSLGQNMCRALDKGVWPPSLADQPGNQGTLARAVLRAVSTTLCPRHAELVNAGRPLWPTP